ncbi:hypothetical protein H8E77_02255 [bacterium]|nr:hypothetical protein [bacterium]
MKKNRTSSIILLVILGTVLAAIYLAVANITFDSRVVQVYPKTSLERMTSICEYELEKVLKSGETILFRSEEMFVQFNVSNEKHLAIIIPLSVSIPYAKPATWARFFMETKYHKIALSDEDEVRLREIPELRGAPVKITSKRKPNPERFIEADLGNDVKRASEIAAEIIKIFQPGPNDEVSHTYADFRKIRWL